jgi:hypothetical protein
MDREYVYRLLANVLSQPHRLVDVVTAADDDPGAVEGIAREFGLTREDAAVVFDQQFKLLTRARMAELERQDPISGS